MNDDFAVQQAYASVLPVFANANDSPFDLILLSEDRVGAIHDGMFEGVKGKSCLNFTRFIKHVRPVAVQLPEVSQLARHMGGWSEVCTKFVKNTTSYSLNTTFQHPLSRTRIQHILYPQSTQSSDNMSESAKVILPLTDQHPSH